MLKEMILKRPVYLDHHATTPVDPRVLEAMLPFFSEEFGNPSSSTHAFGKKAEEAIALARAQVAGLIGAKPSEIIFTSGATESNNLALQGVFEMYSGKGARFVTQVTEHKSVLETMGYLEKKGARVTFLPVDSTGQICMEDLKKTVSDDTLLISIMAASNEIGTLQPIREIGWLAKEKGILFHVDATQAVGKLPINVGELGVDLMSISSHKMYGPKGIGCLYVREKDPRVRLAPLFYGGGQESGLRPGTLNVPGIVGFAKACEIARSEGPEEAKRILGLRDRLERGILGKLDQVYVNGHPTERLAGNLNLSFPYLEGRALLDQLCGEIAVSSGSACTSGAGGSSYVLKALGLGPERTETSIRFGLGRFNTAEEIDRATNCVVCAVTRLREQSPLYQAAIKNTRDKKGRME